MKTETLQPCPFCGETPSMDGMIGTQLEVSCDCGINTGIQKSDHLTIEERDTWNDRTYHYSDSAEEKCRAILAKIWNTRV